jgi:hypothetical protein
MRGSVTYTDLQDRWDADMLATTRAYRDAPTTRRDPKRSPRAKSTTLTRKQQRAAKRARLA